MTISDAGATGQLTDHLDSLRLHLRRRLANEQVVQDLTQEACLCFELTGSAWGAEILEEFRTWLSKFWLVKPKAAELGSLIKSLRQAA